MIGRAVCALQQQVTITGSFMRVSKAAKWLLKHMCTPVFSLGFSVGECLQDSCAEGPAGQARRM